MIGNAMQDKDCVTKPHAHKLRGTIFSFLLFPLLGLKVWNFNSGEWKHCFLIDEIAGSYKSCRLLSVNQYEEKPLLVNLGCLTSLVHMHWLWKTNVTTEASSRELIFNGKYWRTVTGQLESCRWEWWCAGFLQSRLEAFPSFTVVRNDFPDILHPYNKNITILCINQSAQ